MCDTLYAISAVFAAIYVDFHALGEFTLNYVDSDGCKWMYMDLNGLGWVSQARVPRSLCIWVDLHGFT